MFSRPSVTWILLSLLVHSGKGNGQLECKSRLLSNLSDSAFSSSSDFSQKYSAAAARLSADDPTLQYRAWCPKNVRPHDESEFLEIDLGQQSFVKLIITKGLSTADKGGLHLTPHYYIWYRRESGHIPWIKYQNINGTKRIKGNLDAQTERYVSMNPPFVARWIRIYPYTQEHQQVCLKLEIIGCSASGVVEYQALRGTLLPQRNDRMVDTTYDNQEIRQSLALHPQSIEFNKQTFNSGGLGKLVDGKPDGSIDKDILETTEFVGWRRRDEGSMTEKSPFERLIFRFDGTFNFSAVSVLLANHVSTESALPLLVEVRLSRQFPRASQSDPAVTFSASIEPQHMGSRLTQWVWIDLSKAATNSLGKNSTNTENKYDTVARFVELRIYYGGPWLAIAEVKFDNAPFEIPPGHLLEKHPESSERFPASVVASSPFEDPRSQNASNAKQGSHLNIAPIQPHTYALVVGLGCLASILIVLVLILFVHWRRRAFVSRNKLDEQSGSFQHPAPVLLMKSAGHQPPQSFKIGTNTALDATTNTGHTWDFYNSPPVHLPVYMNGDNTGYVAGMMSSTLLPPYMLHGQKQQMVQNSLVLPNYLRTPLTAQRNANGHISPENSSNSGTEGEIPQALFPFYQVHPQSSQPRTTADTTAVYTTVTDADPYVNGTPRPHQIMRVPPPPSIPLPPPPPPSNSGETFDTWGSTLGHEKEYIQHPMNTTPNVAANTFFRYSVPVNGVFPATQAVYSAPVWAAATTEDPRLFQQGPQQRPCHPDGSDVPDYSSTTPVSSIIYGGFYGPSVAYRDNGHQMEQPRPSG